MIPAGILAAELLIALLWLIPLTVHQDYSYKSEDLFTDTDRFGDDGWLGGSLQPGFYVDNTIGASVVTPAFSARRGVYGITVRYDSNGPEWSYPRQTASRVVAADDAEEKGLARLVESEEPCLSGVDDTVSYRVNVAASDLYRVVSQIDPQIEGQYLLVKEISVTRMVLRSVLREATSLIGLFLLIDLFLWMQFQRREQFAAWRRKHGLTAAILLGIVCFGCFPLMERGFFFGYDLYYHMRRIIYLAEGIASGTFPVKIQAWGHGYGYAVGVGYGDLFLLPSALLYLLGFSATGCLEFYVFLMTSFSAVFSFLACERISGSRLGGIAGSVFYTLLGYRLSMAYSGSMFGEYGAYSFLPLVLLGMWGCMRASADDAERHRSENILAIAIACIVGTHVISTLITGAMILLLCILWIRRTLSREILPVLLRAAGKALLLSAWFLVPLMDYMLTMDLDVSRGFVTWLQGLEPARLFLTLPDEAGVAGGFAYLGFASLIVLTMTIGILFAGMTEQQTGFRAGDIARVLLLTAFLIWFSTDLFPLHTVAMKLPALYRAIETIQFNWRVLNYAAAFLALLAAVCVRILQERSRDGLPVHAILAGALIAVCLLQGGEYLQAVVCEGRVVHVLGDDSLADSYHAEFSLQGDSSVLADTRPEVEAENGVTVEPVRRKGTTVRARIMNGTSEAREARFPLWAFRGYRAVGIREGDHRREQLQLYTAEDKRVAVKIPADFSGEVTVRFREPWYWRLSELTSLLMLLYLVFGRKAAAAVRKKRSVLLAKDGEREHESE